MFQLRTEETAILRSQFATSSLWGGRRYSPLAFTEQGIAMLSGVLKSPRAIQVNIHIMRAFVAMRKYAITHEDLARRIDEPEGKYDERFAAVFEESHLQMPTPTRVMLEVSRLVQTYGWIAIAGALRVVCWRICGRIACCGWWS